MNKGDMIRLEEGWATVGLDAGERVYFTWPNGDINWVWRENILEVCEQVLPLTDE